MRKSIIFVLLAFVLLIFNHALVGQGTWQTIKSWQGKSTKNTETFNISGNEWRICWDTRGDGIFSITVYTSDGEMVDLAANVQGNDSDCSIMRGAGAYYLSINTTQTYTIQVQVKRVSIEIKLSPVRTFNFPEAEAMLKEKGYEDIQAILKEDGGILDFYFEIGAISKDNFLNVANTCIEISGEIVNEKSKKKNDIDKKKYVFSPLKIINLGNPEALVVKLRNAEDPISKYLRGQFSPDMQKLLDEYKESTTSSDSLKKALVDELNQIIKKESLYRKDFFADMNLTKKTKELIKSNPENEAILNRLLLEKAYSKELTGNLKYYLQAVSNEKGEREYNMSIIEHQEVVWITSRVIFTEDGERIAFIYTKECQEALKIKDDEQRRSFIESKLRMVE